jgi:hypothetical protein
MRRAIGRLLVLLVLGSAPSCGGSGSSQQGAVAGQGSATVNGDVNGQPVVVSDVIALVGTEMESGVASAYAGVVISNTTGTCALAERGSVWDGNPGTDVLVLDVIQPGATIPPGTYSVGNSGVAQYQVNASSSSNGYAGYGTVTFDSVGDTLEGSFDVQLAPSFHLTGQFTAPVCAGGSKPF